MPDDPNKRGPRDRKRQSKQKHEIKYKPKRKTPGTVNKSKKTNKTYKEL